MLKVLIVEDEMLVRLGISSLINWETLGMSVVAEAGNGQIAWEMYEKEKPDIILTDIKMPVMDGIELIKRIREKDNRTRIVILSCVDDFEYARKALSLDVTGYMLKLTMSQEEMESVLVKAKNDLSKIEKQFVGDKYESYSPQLGNAVLEILLYENQSEDELKEKIGKMNLKIEQERLAVCVMEIDRFFRSEKENSTTQNNPIHFSIWKAITDLLDKYQIGIACHEKGNRFAVIFSVSDLSSEQVYNGQLQQVIGHLRRVIKSYYDSSVTFGISVTRNGYAALKSLHEQAVEAIGCKYFFGTDTDLYFENIHPDGIKADTAAKLVSLSNDIDMSYLKQTLVSYANSELPLLSIGAIKDKIQRLFLDLGHTTLMQSGLGAGNISDIVIKYERQIENSETLDESIEALKRYLKSLLEIKNRKYYRKQIVTVVKYVQDHYAENISLQLVAENVNLNPNYLSSLFKSEYGIGLIDYITKCRIDRAKDLLTNSALRSYEIAELIGFSDESYFCRTFKKSTGMTPNEFRNQTNEIGGSRV